jgi:alpha-tubulin suppressor-like RCC1 family protein
MRTNEYWSAALGCAAAVLLVGCGEATITPPVAPPFVASTIAAGEFATCATAVAPSSGTYCWGRGFDPARLGDATSESLVPRAIANAPALVSLTVGLAHACGLTSDGTAYCWGNNESGQTGTGPGDASVGALPVQSQLRFLMLTAGRDFTCGLALDHTAWCWGDNAVGQLGDATGVQQPAPVAVAGGRVFATLAAGDAHVCGIVAAAEIWCWGLNDTRQLGAETSGTCLSIDQSNAGGYTSWDTVRVNCSRVPVRAAVAPPLVSLSASITTCGLGSDGNAACWGSATTHGSLIYPAPAPLRQVVANVSGMCAVDQSGRTYCGQNTALVRAGPSVPVRSLTGGFVHQCAIAIESGVAYCWGANSYGQLGIGSTVPSDAAVPVLVP